LRPTEITHNAKPIKAKKNGIDPFELGLGMQPTAINPDQTKRKRQKHGIGISIKHDRTALATPSKRAMFYRILSACPDISNRLFCGFIPRTFYLMWPLPYRSAINNFCTASFI